VQWAEPAYSLLIVYMLSPVPDPFYWSIASTQYNGPDIMGATEIVLLAYGSFCQDPTISEV